MKIFSKEVQIALVAIAGIVIMFFGLKFLKGMTMFSSDDNYYAKFDNVAGLSVSSPIYSNGYRVGVVEDVIYDFNGTNKIVAVLGLNNKMRLPNGTKAATSFSAPTPLIRWRLAIPSWATSSRVPWLRLLRSSRRFRT